MKRITIYIAHLLVLVLTGCDKTVLEFPENEGVDPTLVNANLSLAIDPKIEPYEQTGRSEGEVIDAYDVRWIVEVFRDEIGGELAERRVLGCEPAADGHHTIHTSLALHAARYHVVAWMDYVDNGSVDDKYYTIPSLSSISVPAAGNYIGDEDHKDTYVARQEIDLKAHRDRWNETVDVTVTLQRPMAKIEFIATDIDKFLDELAARHSEITGSVADDLLSQTPDLSTIRVQVDYAGYFPSGFNAYTNKPNDARTGMWFECNMTPLTNKEAHLASDYIFVNGSESAVKVDLTIRDSEGNLLNRIEGIDVPIVRGKLTTIRDEFLTRDYAPGIGIDPGFEKIVTILLFALTVFAGCSKDEKPTPAPTMPVNGVIYLHSESVLKNEPAAKAATRGATAAEQTLTYTFEAWTNDTKPRCVLHKIANGTLDEAAIEIALVPGTYDFLFWADYGKGTYTTDNLRQVSLTRTPYTPGSGRDAFAFALPGVQWNGGNGVSATLKRPLAKLAMQNTAAFGTGGQEVSVTYTNVPTQYDVLTETTSAPQTLTLAFPATTAGSNSVGEDFLFVPYVGQSIGLSITVGNVTKGLDMLQLQQNYTTHVTATFE